MYHQPVHISAVHVARWLWLPMVGTFAALCVLSIYHDRLLGRELEGIVSSQCPRVQVLKLWVLVSISELEPSIRSDSLEQITLGITVPGRIDVAARGSITWALPGASKASRTILLPTSQPRSWRKSHGKAHMIRPLPSIGRHLRKLVMDSWHPRPRLPTLMQRFDVIGELTLHLFVPDSVEDCKS